MHGIESYAILPKSQKKQRQEQHEEHPPKKAANTHTVNLMLFKAVTTPHQHIL
jgi:hypothetical protein